MVKRKSSGGGSGIGGIVYGVLAGLLIGLMIAASVAYYLKKSPLPFVDKVSRSPDRTSLPGSVTDAPDPNAAFGNRTGGNPETSPVDVPKVSEEPGTSTAPSSVASKSADTKDDLGDLIATLQPVPQSSNRSQTTPSSVKDPVAKADIPKPEASKVETGKSVDAGASASGGSYYLQVGSFKARSDAETLRAKLILMGISSEIQQAEVGGNQVHRVRVGPFNRLDEMNRVRARLGEEKIPAVVVRQ
jgi:cell division protein FtsN